MLHWWWCSCQRSQMFRAATTSARLLAENETSRSVSCLGRRTRWRRSYPGSALWRQRLSELPQLQALVGAVVTPPRAGEKPRFAPLCRKHPPLRVSECAQCYRTDRTPDTSYCLRSVCLERTHMLSICFPELVVWKLNTFECNVTCPDFHRSFGMWNNPYYRPGIRQEIWFQILYYTGSLRGRFENCTFFQYQYFVSYEDFVFKKFPCMHGQLRTPS